MELESLYLEVCNKKENTAIDTMFTKPGSLVECYDELGTRYSIPVYCLSLPVNLVVEGAEDR